MIRPTHRAGIAVGLALLLALLLASCGGGSPSAPPSAAPPSPSSTASAAATVESVTDGDTLRFVPPHLGSGNLRLVNIDAPELRGDTQEPWAARSRAHLQDLLPPAAAVAIATDVQPVDGFGRLLGHATRARDSLHVNREQIRAGHAALYVIWPNVLGFQDHRAAQVEAQDARRGIWSEREPLPEMPFEYRQRREGRPPFRPAGDYFTRFYVEPGSYRLVHVNNRVFFASEAEAGTAGYRPCPRDAAGGYDAACFAGGR